MEGGRALLLLRTVATGSNRDTRGAKNLLIQVMRPLYALTGFADSVVTNVPGYDSRPRMAVRVFAPFGFPRRAFHKNTDYQRSFPFQDRSNDDW